MRDAELTNGDMKFEAPIPFHFKNKIQTKRFDFWITFLDGEQKAQYARLSHFDQKRDFDRGDHGKSHWFELGNGNLVFSDNLWYQTSKDVIYQKAYEIPHDVVASSTIYEVGRYGLVTQDQKLDQDVQYAREHSRAVETYKQQLDEWVKILRVVCTWRSASCSASVIYFRRMVWRIINPDIPACLFEHTFEIEFDNRLCECGMLAAKRKIYKKTSINKGCFFWGCGNYPNGCKFYYADPTQTRKSELQTRWWNTRYYFSKK